MYTPPSNIYVALSTADPGEAGAGIAEPVGNGYSRAQTAPADWSRADSTMANSANVEFDEATGAWGTVTHFALFDSDENANFLGSAALGTAKSPTAGDVPRFGIGDLTVSLD